MKKIAYGVFVAGVVMLLVAGYFYFFSGTVLFQSEEMPFQSPQTTVSNTFDLKTQGTPYRINMNIEFKVGGSPKNGEYSLFNYVTLVTNSQGQVVSETNQTLSHQVDSSDEDESVTGTKYNNVTLVTLTDVKDDAHALALVITPNPDLPSEISLGDFSYQVKQNVILVSWVWPILGLVLMIVGAILIQHYQHQQKNLHDSDKNTQESAVDHS